MIYAVVKCDKCEKSVWYVHVGKTHVKRWTRKEGWSFGKTDLCPQCKADMRKKV